MEEVLGFTVSAPQKGDAPVVIAQWVMIGDPPQLTRVVPDSMVHDSMIFMSHPKQRVWSSLVEPPLPTDSERIVLLEERVAKLEALVKMLTSPPQ